MKIPGPYSGGIILSYQCNLSCIHCLYNCHGKWNSWINIEKLEKIIKTLKNIKNFTSLHLTGGEPFINFPLLLESVRLCKKYEIPFFVETNCYWAKNIQITEEKLKKLKENGLNSIMLSYSIFYVDKVPIENFEIAMRKSIEIFGSENVSFYTISGYKLIKDLNIKGNLSFEKCLNLIGEKNFINFLKTYIVPKGKVLYTLDKWFFKFPAEKFKRANCVYEFLNPYHIHIDLYGNYMPSFCAGITIGNYEEVLEKGINDEDKVLKFLLNDIYELLLWAESYGYKRKDGYVNKCHLCLDIRKFLIENNFRFDSLKPEEFYKNL